MDNKLNLFWGIVWTVLALLIISSLFWRPGGAVIAFCIAAAFACMYWIDYFRIKKMK